MAGRTRLAPSPTGALHLGNARTFLINWALARQNHWDIVLRIDDLDGARVKPDAAPQAIDDLRWLGIDWDEGPFYQRADLEPYRSALERLIRRGDVYRCECTRRQVQTACHSAPHADHHELRYPGTCRPRSPNLFGCEDIALDFDRAWRLAVPEGSIDVNDNFSGPQSFDVQDSVGDFLVWTKQGLPSYQLAVVVDDFRQRIDQVVRGDDLLSSAARQQLLYDRLEFGRYPNYTHLPLVVGVDGRRLAKRHGDTRVSKYRELGISAERVIALLARWCGMGERDRLTADDFRRDFRLASLGPGRVVFSEADERWLASA